MKVHLIKKAAALVMAILITASLSPAATAYYQCDQSIIISNADGHVDKIMADLDRQSFESEEQRESVKDSIRYLLEESSFAALEQGRFPYLNANGYAETVSDGVHSHTVWAAGCYAYAKWASQVVYGEAGEALYPKADDGSDITSVWSLTPELLKEFLLENCQAGEHLRIDYVHSVCFLACSEEGIYFSDYAGDSKPYIRLCFATYEAFFNAVRTGSAFWLSDVNGLVNGMEQAPGQEPELIDISLSVGEPYISVEGEKSLIDSLGTVPLILNGRTLLPIGAVIKAMGGSVSWDGGTKTVTLTVGDEELKLRIDKAYMWDSEGSYELDCAPVIIGGRTMIPVRSVVEYFGASVGWEASTETVTIKYPAAE